ncbi:unnamed protein product [Peniophora sp. CBMAI 1063]|nr:unnamed protein product [Peniophora sp. CBMAI 1063]
MLSGGVLHQFSQVRRLSLSYIEVTLINGHCIAVGILGGFHPVRLQYILVIREEHNVYLPPHVLEKLFSVVVNHYQLEP